LYLDDLSLLKYRGKHAVFKMLVSVPSDIAVVSTRH